jgi:hypothetical protein
VADGATPRPAVWRGIESLGETVGAYCWLERRVFELTGNWATGNWATGNWATGNLATGNLATGPAADGFPAELRVFFAAVSRRHGSLAERWAARLPARAGVDPSALVVEPPGLPQEVAASLSETPMSEVATAESPPPPEASGAGRIGTLVEILLPWLSEEYGAHLAVASPVCEAPVMEVLVEARRAALGEQQGGRRILERLDATGSEGRADGAPGSPAGG